MGHKHGDGKRRTAAEDDAAHRAGPREQKGRRGSGPDQAEEEAAAWRGETGYRPSVNQMRDEPMPASHHAPHDQEAVAGDAQHATGKVKAGRPGRERKRQPR